MFHFAVRTAVSALALAAPLSALHAEEVAVTADVASDGDDKPIVVEGQRASYGAASTATATKTDTPVRNIPQALTIISRAQIDDQQLRSVGDLLNFVPGASPAPGESNRDQMTLRGNNSTADFFVNGLRDDVQYFRDFYNVERVEVLKGPNAMIFGRGGGGGLVNRVTKRTRFDTVRGASIGSTSFGGVRATADLDQPLTDSIAARVNGLYEKGESFRRHVDLERYGINPTVGFAVGPESRIDLSYEYFRDLRTVDRGLPAFNDRPLRGFDKIFFGDPRNSDSTATIHVGTLALEHRLADGLLLRNRTLVGRYDKSYDNIYPTGLDEATGVVSLGAYSLLTDRSNILSQTELVWTGRLAGIDQTLLAGFEFGTQKSRNLRRTAAGSTTTLDEPTVDRPFIVTSIASDNRTRATTASLYAQGQFDLSSYLQLILGLRLERFRLSVNDLGAANVDLARTDNFVSPRAGLVLKPTDRLSIYGSYSRSFLPQSGDQFSGLDITTTALKPERFTNLEVGAKWEPVHGLLATAAIYQLDRTNTRATDPNDPSRTVLSGAQRSRGIELGLERSITDRWQISAGYAWQDAEISETTTAAPAGRKVPLVPRHSFSAWTRYDVTPALGIGGGLLARSKSYASLSNAVILPGYARVDAAAYYKVARGVEAQLNVENLFGAHYYPAAHSDNNIAPGAPRSAKVTLNFGL